MKRETEAAAASGGLAGSACFEPMIEVPQRLFMRLVDRALNEPFQALSTHAAMQLQGFNRIAPRIGSEYKGGIYAGITVHAEQPCELILLPDENPSCTWKDAIDWAEKQGGVLPSRIDQLALFKNVKAEFKEAWYWSGEQSAGNSGYAWYQDFSNGTQYGYHEGYSFRARAVRRLPIQ